MDALKRQRGGIKASLTNFIKFVEGNITDAGIGNIGIELENRLNTVEVTVLQKFIEIQDRIEVLCDENELEREYKERADFENKYYNIIAIAKKHVNEYLEDKNSRNGSQHSRSHNGSLIDTLKNVKLPDINLPEFDGSLRNWLEFRDVFESLIHSNESISDIQRFHYLRASLRGEPAQLISSIEFSANNYKIAWELLGKRYNNNKMLIHNHIKNIFSIEPMSKESPKAIRGILNDLTKNLRALSQIGLSVNEWDVPIVYLISTKLDKSTNREWESFKSRGINFPKLDDLKAFLLSKAELLENLEQSRVEKNISSTRGLVVRDDNDTYKQSDYKTSKCVFCNSEHYIQSCPKFLKIPVEKRAESIISLRLCLNCLRPGHFNKGCRRSTCKKCHAKHHTLLHKNKSPSSENQMNENDSLATQENVMPSPENSRVTINNSASSTVNEVLLSTALVEVFDKSKNKTTLRVLLDSGSQSSFITEDAYNKLKLVKENVNISLNGINGSLSTINYKCNTKIYSKNNTYSTAISCFIVPKITGTLPISEINVNTWSIPNNYKLADPLFFKPQQVDMLIGADLFWSIIENESVTLGRNNPLLQKTKLGWVITGPLCGDKRKTGLSCNVGITVEQQIQDDLRKFWELDNYEVTAKLHSEEEMACEKHFLANTKRNHEGAFVVKLPVRMEVSKLGNSFNEAKKRFLSLERRLNANSDYKRLYCEFIEEYIQLGHMSKVNISDSEASSSYYMSHHGVYREEAITTSLRVVFDASLPSNTGFSLNNILMTGPTIQQDLISILTRFRQHGIVIAADCTKMYRSVLVNEEDRSLQKILWRFNTNESIDTYILNTVTYGTTPASFLAIRCLFEIADQVQSEYPNIANIIRNDFYVDDLLTGADNVDEAKRITELVFNALKTGCFILRKFVSNEPSILDGIPNNDPLTKIIHLGESDGKKILGLTWCPAQDKLMFNVKNIPHSKAVTKRVILSNSSKIFDPLGLISPCIIVIKMLLQSLWLEKLAWDDQVPNHIATVWSEFMHEVKALNDLKIERHVLCKNPMYIEMHCFSDSSEKAYGSCIYLRSVDTNNDIYVHLLASKAKVAPLQSVTLPRLELCGALVAAKLADKVSTALRLRVEKRYFWTDSTIVLGWIKTPPNKLKTFVGNRVSEIQTLTNHDVWRHVPTGYNPADYLSRGVKCTEINNLDVWWHGPKFLQLDQSDWPKNPQQKVAIPDLRKVKTSCNTVTEISENHILHRFSTLVKLKRIVALLRRFVNNCKRPTERNTGPLLKDEIDQSFKLTLKHVQQDVFKNEINQIQNQKLKSCKILSLNPFIDQFGLLRVGGRLSNAKFEFEKKHPLILPYNHQLTKLILRHEHIKLYHCGPQHLLASIRESYWPISGRNLCKRIVHDCVKCSRYNPKALTPIMGNLPEHRLVPKHPFDVVGVDYAGPFLIKSRTGRGAKLSKAYVALYVCFLTKAVHLELVTDLTTQAFVLSLRRFSARRGKPSTVFSDNGSNFIGACSELKDLGRFINDNEVTLTNGLCNEDVDWHFIPPQSPHFGGLWEAGVKTMKYHLKRVVSDTPLTFEHFYTLLVEVEAIMNSRPLSVLSPNPDDLTPLTPAHFLIGRQLSPIPSPDVRSLPCNRLLLYQHLQQMKQHIWTRWSREYISELQQRRKWRQNSDSLKPGAIVLVKDDNAPPMKWKMGKVVEVFLGKDSVARVALIKTDCGLIKRPFTKICPLPIDS